MTVLPEKIKQDGYNATRRGENYIVEYISGGHIPQEESINWHGSKKGNKLTLRAVIWYP